MYPTTPSPPLPIRRPRARALLPLLCTLLPTVAAGLGPEPDAREQTYLEYSRNLVAAYPDALARRIREMRQRATRELSATETCSRALAKVPGDLEDNPHRRIELVAAGPIGREPDAWERRALAELASSGRRARHAIVHAEATGGEVFRYIERLDGLPAPCGALLQDTEAGPAVSILRAAGGARARTPDPSPAPRRLPHPLRQGPKR